MPFTFDKLPVELQEMVLSWTPLVHRFQPVDRKCKEEQPQGIWIKNGKTNHPCAPLLCVNRSFSAVAKQVLFTSENRFILSGDPNFSFIWLAKQPQYLLRRVRKLDLLLQWNDLMAILNAPSKGLQEMSENILTHWRNFVAQLPHLFDISKLNFQAQSHHRLCILYLPT